MPETEKNIQLGMFVVCGEMRDIVKDSYGRSKHEVRHRSCRSALLRHRSNLNRAISTLVMSPLFILGLTEETQKIPVELFPDYEFDSSRPVAEIYVEIQTKEIQFYSVTMQMTAKIPEFHHSIRWGMGHSSFAKF